MRALIACEYTGAIRDHAIQCGIDAWSCDVRPSSTPGPHLQCDVLDVLDDDWDLMIAHPPCTHLASSGAQWWGSKMELQTASIEFVLRLWNAPIHRIAIENPIGILSSAWREPHQIVQPWWFGDEYSKSTCFWLKNLPLLRKTQIVDRGKIVVHGGKRIPEWYSNRQLDRSATFPGMARAIVDQWMVNRSIGGFWK